MKIVILSIISFLFHILENKAQNVQLTLKDIEPADSLLIPDARKALEIASFFLSSKEFRDSVSKLDFEFSNQCIDCKKTEESENHPRTTGQEVINAVYKRNQVALSLTQQKRGRALGATCPWTDEIVSRPKRISATMPQLPFAYAYAAHICHEFIHNVGYCHHKKANDDVAIAIGEIAYFYINKWYLEKKL